MKASIIIPTKDKLSRLRLTLKALEGQINNEVEVIIVFDGCSAATLDNFNKLKFAFPTINIISQTGVGRAAARNIGINAAKGDIIIFLDDDRVPAEGFVAKHIAAHEGKSKCVVLGRRNEVYLAEDTIEALFESDDLHREFRNIGAGTKPYFFYSFKSRFLFGRRNPLRYIIFSTGNVSVDRTIFDITGVFDEGFKGWGQEDADLGYRIAKHRFQFYLDDSIVNYHLAHTINKENKREEGIRNLKYFGAKYQNDFVLQLLVCVRKILLMFGV